MEDATIESLKISLRKTIAAHSHVVSRVKKDDERTMRVHLMSMLDKVEKDLVKHFSNIKSFGPRKSLGMLIRYAIKRPKMFCSDSYINQICFVMQYYFLQMKLINKKYNSPEDIKREKGKLARETSARLFQIQI